MKNRFEQYLLYVVKKGKIVSVNPRAVELKDEGFMLFKSLFDSNYGSIEENDNLVSIHTGGWSDNEELVEEFKQTAWWIIHNRITAVGGHYFFNTNTSLNKSWEITVNEI